MEDLSIKALLKDLTDLEIRLKGDTKDLVIYEEDIQAVGHAIDIIGGKKSL